MELEGIVAKRIGSRHRSRSSPDWIESKHLATPAGPREAEADWGAVARSAGEGRLHGN